MKCIKKHGKIRRVSDELARKLVNTDKYKFCPKHEWKEQNKKEK